MFVGLYGTGLEVCLLGKAFRLVCSTGFDRMCLQAMQGFGLKAVTDLQACLEVTGWLEAGLD